MSSNVGAAIFCAAFNTPYKIQNAFFMRFLYNLFIFILLTRHTRKQLNKNIFVIGNEETKCNAYQKAPLKASKKFTQIYRHLR